MRHARPTGMQALSTMNVTPLIDVMLCLLIIFMIAMPILNQRLSISILATDKSGEARLEPLRIYLDAQGRITLDRKPISGELLEAEFAWQGGRQEKPRLEIEAHETVPYQRVAEILIAAHSNGISQIGLD